MDGSNTFSAIMPHSNYHFILAGAVTVGNLFRYISIAVLEI